MKIAILQTGHVPDSLSEKYGSYGDMFTQLLDKSGFNFKIYSVVDNQFPASFKDYDGYVITGSRHGVYEKKCWISVLEKFIQECYQSEIPLAGFCFGHQIMAQALGGKVEKFSKGWSAGNIEYKSDTGDKISVMAWHQDQIITPPKDTTTIFKSDFCEYAGLSYDKKGFSLQSHPEISSNYMKDLMKERGDILPQDIKKYVINTLDNSLSTDYIADMIIAFFKQSHEPKIEG